MLNISQKAATTSLVLLAFICLASSMQSFKAPWFCHDLDCPPYNVTTKASDYEIRTYQGGLWASTNIASKVFRNATSIGFQRLFNYIDGGNEFKQKIPMTAPVRVKVIASQGPFCDSNFTESFYLPYKYQHWQPNPEVIPKPSNPLVFIDEDQFATEKFAVIEFSGYATDEDLVVNAKKLVTALEKDGVKFDESSYFYAGYDPPFRLFNRHNEVWVKLL